MVRLESRLLPSAEGGKAIIEARRAHDQSMDIVASTRMWFQLELSQRFRRATLAETHI